MSYLNAERFILAIKKTPVILNALLKDVTQEQAERLTDGPDGWSVIETLCHIVDFGAISVERIGVVLAQDGAAMPVFDQLAMAAQRQYKTRPLRAEFDSFLATRRKLVALLEAMQPSDWQRTGLHSNFGTITLLEYALHIFWHDLNHIEQITRSLGLSDALV